MKTSAQRAAVRQALIDAGMVRVSNGSDISGRGVYEEKWMSLGRVAYADTVTIDWGPRVDDTRVPLSAVAVIVACPHGANRRGTMVMFDGGTPSACSSCGLLL